MTTRVTYLRRRAAVAVSVIVLVVGLVLVMAQGGAALGGSAGAAPDHRPTAAHAVVRPGDSLWSIAQRLAPGSDPRPVVDALAAARHGAVLQPGETIEWDG